MHTNLTDVIDAISTVNGRITLKDLPPEEIDALADKVLWAYGDRRSIKASYTFGGSDFRPKGIKKGLVIQTGSHQYDFELKSIMLLLLHSGLKEGSAPYKWPTVSQRTRTLVKLARYCSHRGLRSFRALESLPAMKLRTLLLGFLMDETDKGGMNAGALTSAYKTVRNAVKHLTDYGLVRRDDFMEMVDEFTLVEIEKHEAENRLRHSIIPTGVMKRLIAEATGYLAQAEEKFKEFAAVFRQTHRAFGISQCADPLVAVRSVERHAAKRLADLLETYFRDLQRHTYALVLSFTGMRDGEAGALKTHCAGRRTENGEEIFYVRSLLSKTDDNAIPLDWIANDLAYRAVTLLSKVNELYYERGRLLLKHFSDRLTEQQRNEVEHGLADEWLFGLRFTAASAFFVGYTKGSDGVLALSLDKYSFPVTDDDLTQLEQMECNYRSVAANSGHRGKPYSAGDPFNLTAHQFRHTFAWFIIANRLGDLDDIKYQFKHLHRAMTMVYAERGFKSLNELRIVIEQFEAFVNGRAIDDIVHAAELGKVAGGGGERLARMLRALNAGQDHEVYGTEQLPHFKDTKEIIAFTTRHSEAIRGLPHGYCTKGPSCKIKNAADPSHCLYCDTYFATPKHLPFWRAIKINCETKIEHIDAMPMDSQQQFQVFRQSLEDNLFAATKIVARLEIGMPTAMGAK